MQSIGGLNQTVETPYSHIVVLEDLMVPMRDGTRLAADVYRPATDAVPEQKPLPALLCGGWYDSYTRATLDTFMA